MSDPIRGTVRVVVCGEKWVAEQCLEFLYERSDTKLCAVVASPKDWQANLISWGAKRRVKVFVGNIKDYCNEIASLEPHFVFSIQYRPLLKPPILGIPTNGCINLHFGLLPRYGGCYPIAWAILNGEKEAGATLHYMTEKFDEGDIIAQTAVPITIRTTARELFDAVSKAAVQLFTETYPKLCDGRVEAKAQDVSQKLYYDKDSIDFDRDHFVDWSKSALGVQRQVYAFTFEPFQLPASWIWLLNGQQQLVTIGDTYPQEGNPSIGTVPGQVVEVTDNGTLIVATGNNGTVEIGMLDYQNPEQFLISLGCNPCSITFKQRKR